MAAFSGHVCPLGPQIIIWDSTELATTTPSITVDAREVRINGPRPGGTEVASTNYAVPRDTRNRAERRAAAAMGRKGRR
jgi:hypothetical protein